MVVKVEFDEFALLEEFTLIVLLLFVSSPSILAAQYFTFDFMYFVSPIVWKNNMPICGLYSVFNSKNSELIIKIKNNRNQVCPYYELD